MDADSPNTGSRPCNALQEHIEPTERRSGAERKRHPGGVRAYRGKCIFDLTCAALALLPALVIGIVCALAIRMTSKGPVFFRQGRVGKDGTPFTVLKFRTMKHSPEKLHSIFPDPADITFIGKWLRRLSLDELPQLINVFRGEMSIVGPRPTLAYQVTRYSERQRQRLSVRPGITGLAQIRGRNELMWADRIEHDIEYLGIQSPLLDAIIIYKTILTVAVGTGVSGHSTVDILSTRNE